MEAVQFEGWEFNAVDLRVFDSEICAGRVVDRRSCRILDNHVGFWFLWVGRGTRGDFEFGN